MKIMEISGKTRLPEVRRERVGCRGIVLNGSMLLLSYAVNDDLYFIPGGGLEAGETLSECCRREIAEETGILAAVGEQYLTINEYHGDWHLVNHYFVCTQRGIVPMQLTEQERKAGFEPRWVPLTEALAIYSRYAEYHEVKCGLYYRELCALQEFIQKTSA